MSQAPQERLPVIVADGDGEIEHRVAQRIAALIREKGAVGKAAVLGLATGSTPMGIYRELIRMHREEHLDFAHVVTFNLDEYYPMEPDSLHSYHRYMWENLFEHVNIDPEHVHIPRGDLPRDDVVAHCADYERRIREVGGLDLQLLGIGQTGHIGFNEPGSSIESRTRLVTLDTITRRTAAADFFGEDNVPAEAISMGVATILDADEVILMATGEHKAAVIHRAVEEGVDPAVAATYLQRHANATVYLDGAAAAELTRVKTPWMVGPVAWTPQLEVRALIWLSAMTDKSLLKLVERDYREHELGTLLMQTPSVSALNERVFATLMGKVRDREHLPRRQRIVVFSPHPDDDVISAGGILRALHENDNEIIVAYQTSGCLAVFDHEVRRYLDFIGRMADDVGFARGRLDKFLADVEATLDRKAPGDIDTPMVQAIKRRIREAEAVSGIETLGLHRKQARFLDLPFYRTGRVRKDPVGPQDVQLVLDLLNDVRPELVFAAGDLSDPHGTHRMCLDAIDLALERYQGDPPDVWYYRGAWQEWSPAEADVLVPLSEADLRQKIQAIFKHESQKDKAPFPGVDEREFWQRVEERNRTSAAILDRLGLPEYFALEAYVVRKRNGGRVGGDGAGNDAPQALPALW